MAGFNEILSGQRWHGGQILGQFSEILGQRYESLGQMFKNLGRLKDFVAKFKILGSVILCLFCRADLSAVFRSVPFYTQGSRPERYPR